MPESKHPCTEGTHFDAEGSFNWKFLDGTPWCCCGGSGKREALRLRRLIRKRISRLRSGW